MAFIISALPGVTANNVYHLAGSIKFLLIVEIELEHGVALELVCVGLVTATVMLMVLPCFCRVGRRGIGLVCLAHIVTKVKVSVEFRQEMHRIIKLQVTVAAVDVGIVVFVLKHTNRIERGVVVELNNTF